MLCSLVLACSRVLQCARCSQRRRAASPLGNTRSSGEPSHGSTVRAAFFLIRAAQNPNAGGNALGLEEPDDALLYPTVEPRLATAILGAISAYALLEYQVDELIWELAAVEPEIGACLTAQFFSIAPRMDALISVAHAQYVSDAHIKRLDKLKTSIGGLGNRRHRLAHDPWFYAYETAKSYRLEKTAKGGLVHAYKPVSEEEIDSFKDEIKAVEKTFRDLCSEILDAFRSQPYRPPRMP